jgi:peptidylprolyl isomerase
MSTTIAKTIDLTGDVGVLKTVVRKAKDDATSPSDRLPLVDGMKLIYHA